MKQVNKKTFYKSIGKLNTKLTVIGSFPFTVEFKVNNKLIGKTVDSYKDGIDRKYPIVTTYFTNN